MYATVLDLCYNKHHLNVVLIQSLQLQLVSKWKKLGWLTIVAWGISVLLLTQKAVTNINNTVCTLAFTQPTFQSTRGLKLVFHTRVSDTILFNGLTFT